MILIRHRLTVRFRDCDPLGHVNHAVYLTFLEQARFTLWRRQLSQAAHGFILARAEIDYRAQARYGDEIEVRLSLGGFGRTSFTYTYDVVDTTSDALLASAKTVLVRFDYAQQKPVPIDEDLRARLSTPQD